MKQKMFTSASTLGVKTSSDLEDFLGFSGGVAELVVGCVGITLGVVGTAIPGVGSTIGWGMYEKLVSASNSTFTKVAVSGNENKKENQLNSPYLIMENDYKAHQTKKKQTNMTRFMLEGLQLCTVFCFVLLH